VSKIININKKYLYGRNPIKEKLQNAKSGKLYIQNGTNLNSINDIIEKAKSNNISITFLDKDFFNTDFKDKNHQGIVFEFDDDVNYLLSEEDFVENIKANKNLHEMVLILDGIKDVGNFGSILRSALLFGVNYVILPKDNSCPVNDVVVKRSSGAVEFIKVVYVTNIVRTVNFLKENNYWVYATDKNGVNLKDVKFTEKSVIIMGEEGRGIRRLVKENSDYLITIPTNQKIDSLNVANAASIILYDYYVKNI